MRIGTRSVLFGAHQFLLHPWFVAWGWWRLFGFPFDPRLWVAFFVHDLGYIGKPNLDGDEGEAHPELGARIMTRLFDRREPAELRAMRGALIGPGPPGRPWLNLGTWGRLSLYHSRFYARRHGAEPSRLCYADKLAIVLTPRWLYLPMVKATGEVHEYMALAEAAAAGEGKYAGELEALEAGLTFEEWHGRMCVYLERWVAEELGR